MAGRRENESLRRALVFWMLATDFSDTPGEDSQSHDSSPILHRSLLPWQIMKLQKELSDGSSERRAAFMPMQHAVEFDRLSESPPVSFSTRVSGAGEILEARDLDSSSVFEQDSREDVTNERSRRRSRDAVADELGDSRNGVQV
jgi:hypothetical protein